MSPTRWSMLLLVWLAGCSPTVKLQAPDKPIRFDVNVNVTQEVRVRIDRELQDLIDENPALFGTLPPMPEATASETPS